MYFIRKHFDFSIGRAQGLRFWLIPSLDPSFVKGLLEYVESKALYLRNLRSICGVLKTIEEEITEEATEIEEPPFLTYIALFYYLDQQGHMRVLTSADGIYPNRLKEIVKEKSELDRRYPYFALPKFSSRLSKIYFGFPILADFWLHSRETGGQKELAELISSVYLAYKVDVEYVNSILIKRIRGELRGSNAKVGIKSLENLVPLVFKAMMTMEFLEKVKVISMKGGSALEPNDDSDTDDLVKELLGFLNKHQEVIVPGAQRAICCAGVITGIALVEQEEKIGSTSFWSRLNRLELNFERIRSLVPQAVEKLRQFRAMDKYKNLVAHILANEISQLDEKEAKRFSNDLISLMFSIGIGEGYLLTKLAKKQSGE
jgi:CRISPR-associated protein Cas8b/Csh1 subtype I-B